MRRRFMPVRIACVILLINAATCGPIAAAGWTIGATEGTMLVAASRESSDDDAMLMELTSGRQRPLPRSAFSRRYSESDDAWYAGAASSVLVRVDGLQNVEFFDRKSLARRGGFSLRNLPGVDSPKFYGPVKPSPDGRYVLAYWKKSYKQTQPIITVFDRGGVVVVSGSPYAYDRFAHRAAFDWLPDGRYIYLAGTKIVAEHGGQRHGASCQSGPPGKRQFQGGVI